MLILAVDTSGKDGSIALVQFEGGSSRALEIVALEGGTFSAQLVPQISEILKKHNLANRDIDGFAVVSGPGSFTGLRVGLAVIKALAEVLQKPIAAVSLLEAVALAGGRDGKVQAALDAGRGGIYSGEYLITGGRAAMTAERLITAEEFDGITDNSPIITPDDAIAERARRNRNGSAVIKIDAPKAAAVARIGFLKLQTADVVSPEDLDANYIRRTDAEVKKSPGTPTQ